MLIGSFLFFFAGLLDTKPSPIFVDVHFGTRGPYRFLVDTGAQTSLIDPRLASKLHLRPEFRSEVLTRHSSHLVPGMKLSTLRLGQRALPEMEVLIDDVSEVRRLDSLINGVLGINALTGFNFTLLPAIGRLDDSTERPVGEVVPFSWVEGRITIKAKMGSETLALILDSGSTNVVLFRTPAAMAKTPPVETVFSTIEGARRVVPTCWTAEMFLTDRLRIGMVPAAIVERKDTQVDGLMPVSIFKKVYIDHARGELVLVR